MLHETMTTAARAATGASPVGTAPAIAAAKTVPAAGPAVAKSLPAAKTGTAALSAAKAILFSPLFGVAALGGIIAFGVWKSRKDAEESKSGRFR